MSKPHDLQMSFVPVYPKSWFRGWHMSPIQSENREVRVRLAAPSIEGVLDAMDIGENRPSSRALVLGRGRYLGILTWDIGTVDERVTTLLIEEETVSSKRVINTVIDK